MEGNREALFIKRQNGLQSSFLVGLQLEELGLALDQEFRDVEGLLSEVLKGAGLGLNAEQGFAGRFVADRPQKRARDGVDLGHDGADLVTDFEEHVAFAAAHGFDAGLGFVECALPAAFLQQGLFEFVLLTAKFQI